MQLRINQARADSFLTNDQFLAQFQHQFGQTKIGCSIKPEHFTADEYERKLNIQTAKFAVEELGMREVRIGIRWNRVQLSAAHFSLDYYRELLDYCFANRLPVCLNVGPIKSIGWPEEHVPQFISARPPVKAVIDSTTELAKLGADYLHILITLLRQEYGPELETTTTLQADNEPFFRFGEQRWTFTSRYVSDTILNLHTNFPYHKLLISSAGRNNLHQILPLFDQLKIDYQQLILGYNYYYKLPEPQRIPVLRQLDNLFTATPWHLHMAHVKQEAARKGFAIEVSEAQAEPWTTVTSPGNSAQEFRFVLLRCVREVTSPNSTIRYWGIEELAKKHIHNQLNAEHYQIIELIKALNT